MKNRKYKIFAADFETTVYDGQEATEVWLAGCCEIYTENVKVFKSIREQFEYFAGLKENIILYYHNLKFDGSFWLYFLLHDLELEQALVNNDGSIEFQSTSEMSNNSFTYSISSLGQWYRIIIKYHNYIIEFRDSLKLLPFSLDRIGKSFKTKHKKLEMQYKGFRYSGCDITENEMKYFENDIFVLKEALEIVFNNGHKKLTIGSCCLHEYKELLGRKTYARYFPNMYDEKLDELKYGQNNVGDYIKNSYHGGWCYLKKGKENKVYSQGITLDVNSLYPSMMSSESGNIYPIGYPTFWKGNYIPDEALDGTHYYFVRIKTMFHVKQNYLPFIQIKNSMLYKANEMLETSDVYNSKTGKYYSKYIDLEGKEKESYVILTMTMTDYELFKEHYNLVNFEILDGCYFQGAIGIFDSYIEKYKKIKLESKDAERELAKLFLNNLYGKMASSPMSNFKVAYLKDTGELGYYTVLANDKIPGYIPVGSAITSYARNFTIRAAQLNYKYFIYADTDSIHCHTNIEKIKGVKLDDKNFCCWKHESTWDLGLFVRQKTYIERENGEYNIKCAGMPEKCKKLFLASITGEEIESENEEEQQFVKTKRKITDFKTGLSIPGKLVPKNIPGGIVLVDTTYMIK